MKISSMVVIAILFITGCTTAISDNDLIESGQLVYAQSCASCHGVSGEGQNPENPLSKDETGRFPAPPHDNTGHTWHHDDDLLIQIIREGGMGNLDDFHEMPAFGDVLSDGDIEAVLAFIKTMWTDQQRERQQQVTNAVREQSQ